ncbi:hypothetical protein LZ32DRAFT_39729 [Colletotrichum eremochloae]|nr:hypothetical protein LZ32DRAFT_39729 [Colletotrichum eremochloae]
MDKPQQPATPLGCREGRDASSTHTKIHPANAVADRSTAFTAPRTLPSWPRRACSPHPAGPTNSVATRGSSSPHGFLFSQKFIMSFTDAEFAAIIDALRSQPMPDTPIPLSRHSLASVAGPLKRIDSPKNNSLASPSCFKKAADPQPSSTAPPAAVLEGGAYRPVTRIPCQDPGSRYRPGRIARSCEEQTLPDHRSELTQAGSADQPITGPIIRSSSNGADRTPMDALAREAVYASMGRLFLEPKTPLGPGAMQLRNMSQEKLSTGQELPSDKEIAPRPQAAQKTPDEKPLEKGANLNTQMDYFLYFNAPMVGTSHN